MSWIPDPLKQQIVDAVVEFLSKQSEDLIGQQFGDKIRGISSQGALRNALSNALEHGITRFQLEYADIDEDLAAAIIDVPDFWNDQIVQKAILKLVANPGIARPDEQDIVVAHFESVLPTRRNRTRVDQAVSHLLRLVAEEVWAVPGAGEIRQLYALQMQRLNTEALQQQINLLRANLQATTQLSADIRQMLLQLTDAAEQRLLSAATMQSLPQRARPYHNLPNRSYSRFVGRTEELQQLLRLLHPRSRHFLVTLDGIGGVGKSALALECAYRYRDAYTTPASAERFDAIIWISAKRTILTASGIQQRQQTFNTLADLYREIATVLEQPAMLQADIEQRRGLAERALANQRTLLIVDNLETVDDQELLTFLRELPEPTKAVVTTRHRIDIAYAIRLTGMPETDALILMAVEAARKNVELPVEHAGDLYRRTGGIPLAIVWSIGLMSLGHGVEAVLRRLGSGHSDIARFCFTESVANLQGRDAERLLQALALFDASVSRGMLGDVAGLAEDEIGRDDGLVELEQLSLINKEGDRFNLLPLTRVFVLEELAKQPRVEEKLREQWIHTLTSLARPYRLPDWRLRDLDGLKRDGNHLLTVANWARQTHRVEDYLAVVPALMSYYDCIGDWKELVVIGRDGIDYAQLTTDPIDQLRLENILAWILSQQGEHSEAEKRVTQALRIAEQISSPEWQIDVIQTYSQVVRRQFLFDDAIKICDRANILIRQIPEEHQPYVRANIEYELGKIARDGEAWESAERHFLEARIVYNEDVKDPVFNLEWIWGLLSNLGLVSHKLGHLDLALERYKKALSFFQQGGSIGNIATLLVRLSELQLERGDKISARHYAENALELSQRLGLAQEQKQLIFIFARLEN
jgi:LuxR family glucitol operon transcriptional activator